MNKILKNLTKELFINAQHQDNPFISKDARFFVRVIAVREGWVAYANHSGSLKYCTYPEFIKTFRRPETIRGSICRNFFIDRTLSRPPVTPCVNDCTVLNPWVGVLPEEEYKADTMTCINYNSL